MDKQKRKELLMQKYQSKKEIAFAKNELKESLSRINNEMQKAKAKQRRLASELRDEESKIKYEDRKEKQKHKAEILKQRRLIQENKKLLFEKKKTVRNDLRLKKEHAKNITLNTQKSIQMELSEIKKEIREERLMQREKLANAKSKITNKKLKMNQKVAEIKNENSIFYARAKEALTEKEKAILQLRKELMIKRSENSMRFKAKKAAQQETNKIEKEELRKQKLAAQKDFKETFLKLKENRMSNQKERSDELAKLRSKQTQATENELQNKISQNKEEVASKVKDAKELLNIKKKFVNEAKEIKKETKPKTEYKDSTVIFGNEFEDENHQTIKPQLKGQAIGEMGRAGLKLFEKIEGKTSKLNIKNLSVPNYELNTIKEMIALKENNTLTRVTEFVKYIEFLLDENIGLKKANLEIAKLVAAILKGKTLQVFGGYFKINKINGYRFIKYYKSVPGTHLSVVSLPDSLAYKKLEEIILKKLESGLIIQIANNIAIKQKQEKIEVLHDLPFLR